MKNDSSKCDYVLGDRSEGRKGIDRNTRKHKCMLVGVTGVRRGRERDR